MRCIFLFVELDVLPFTSETEGGDDDIPTINDILAASFVNVRLIYYTYCYPKQK